MQLEEYFDFLANDDIRIKGTRIGNETVLNEFIHRSRSDAMPSFGSSALVVLLCNLPVSAPQKSKIEEVLDLPVCYDAQSYHSS